MAADFHGVDQELLEHVRFRENPRACISDETVAYAASLIRQIPEYRKALKQEMAVAVPEKRTGLFGLKRIPPVMAWRVIGIEYDQQFLSDHSNMCCFQAFIDSDDRLYCGWCEMHNPEKRVTLDCRPTSEVFARLLMETFSDITIFGNHAKAYDAKSLNEWLQKTMKSVFEYNMVPDKNVPVILNTSKMKLHILEELQR